MYAEQLLETLRELIRLPSTSGHEERIRTYLEEKLLELGIACEVDEVGNLIAYLSGDGQPILLNAHMDRVLPGKGHEPVFRDGNLYSDGTTNLGADDAAGITVILEIVRRIIVEKLPHPPLLLVFTVEEEVGLCGATRFDGLRWGHVKDGIVFDNAFEAGVVVDQGAAYEAFIVDIHGKTGHPGKDLSSTVSVIEIFRHTPYPHGSLDHDQTRIAIGLIQGGQARNAIPDHLRLEGEIRSYAPLAQRERYKKQISEAFVQTARQYGGDAEVEFISHSTGYHVELTEPLLHLYSEVLSERGERLQTRPTFIGSDTSGFRPAIRVFTLSTGVMNEHSLQEYVPVEPLEQLVVDTLRLLQSWIERSV